MYRHAPGLLDEFKRTQLVLGTSEVGSYPDMSLMVLGIIRSGISKGRWARIGSELRNGRTGLS
jgi:hypothetical protein